MNLKVSEIFHSVQGEGTNVGKPSVFLRTAACNLKCSWCDTKYTWDWDNYDYNKEVKEMEIKEIKNELLKFDAKNLVITGGEPLLQQDVLIKLFEEIKSLDYFIEIETNCTIKPAIELLNYVDQWNVSPKLANSGNRLQMCEISECYNFFSGQTNSFFKFVVSDNKDLEEIESLVKKYNLDRKRVLLMPQAANRNEYFIRKDIVHDFSKRLGFGYSGRMHIELWDNQRGKKYTQRIVMKLIL